MTNTDTPRPRMPLVPGPAGTTARKETAGLTQHAPVNIAVAQGGQVDKMQSSASPLARMPGPTGKISKAIANCMKEVGTIKKRGVNEFFNYRYARFEDLLYAITPLMGEQGLALTQSEIKVETVEGNRLSILYEFIMYHESGESLPPQMHRGMCTSRSRKGDFDDKAVAKCHTAAKKQFLLGQFNVPAGDFEDPDEDTDATQKPVPGPSQEQAAPQEKPGPARGAVPAQAKSAPQEATPSAPHRLELPQGTTADVWASAYIRAIGTAKSEDEIKEWDRLHDDVLQRISDRYSQIYDTIAAAVERRLSDIGGALPDPKKDPQEAMNWIASQLQQMNTYEAAEAFWNQIVAPREKDFEQLDWEMLMAEWVRTEARLNAPPQDAA